MHIIKRLTLLLIGFAGVIFNKPVYASATRIPLQYLGIEQGLSNNAVTCIYKDHYGFMWFGTYDGLNRYDGYGFKVFRNVLGDKSSLNNHINAITEDHQNRVWIGTQRGLGIFNYLDSKVAPVYYISPDKKKRKRISADISALQTDKKGNVYIGSNDEGLFVYQKNDTLCRQVPLNTGLTNYTVQSITIDNLNRIWLFIKEAGLCIYDIKRNHIRVVDTRLVSVICLTGDKSNNVYIGTESGLFKYNVPSRGLTNLSSQYKLTSDNISNLCFTRAGQLWLATNGGGINILDLQSNKVDYILPRESKGSITSGAVSAIYEDGESRKWVATLRGGVNVIDDKRHQFKLINHDPFNKNSVINDFALSFCEDENKNIWIGTDGGGLSYWNIAQNKFTNYNHKPGDKGSLSSDFVVSILKDHTNRIWIATFNGGIDLFNKETGVFKHYDCYNTAKKVVEKNLWKLYEDDRHNLWAGNTRGGALYLYNKAADRFELFDKNLTNIHALYQDAEGNLWGGNYVHLIKIDLKNKKHLYYNINYAIRTILEDNAHNFWIGTEGGGLLLFNRGKGTYTRYTEKDGFASNSVLNILQDKRNNIWFSTFNGLSRFNPHTKKVKNYYASDGLQSNQFNYNAALKTSNGDFLFGGIKGFNRFNPDSISTNTHRPLLTITGFKINNTPAEYIPAYTDHTPVVSVTRVTIPYNQATIAVDYGALEYSFPDKISYAYYLEGWDHGWNYVDKLRTAYYSRLDEGSYTLKIKSTNTEGVWNGPMRIIHITVLPPWYRTWWAYLIYISVAGSIVYGFWVYRTRQTKLKYEVEIANMKVEREKELNEKKLSFFTNVSHEFRTPLTLIINPIKDLLQSNNGKANSELNTIYRNARRLLGLVDHLLLFRKTESENDLLKLSNLNFTGLCKDVYQCFIQQAKMKNIQYSFNCSNEDVYIAADREKIEIALFNLISNALKFTPEGGKIDIILAEQENSVLLEVADNGCGIAEGTGEKLFDKFYQIKGNTSLKTGFGIGLYLVKSFIKSHEGSITYVNNQHGGTTFTVELPKGKLLAAADLFEDTADGQHLIDELINDEAHEIKLPEDDVNNLELLISDRQSVLIIDDNTQLRGYIRKIFKDTYKIYEADSGELGLEMIKRFLPDIVISDIMMPGLNGIDLCRTIKQDTSLSHIPVILLTGDPNPEIKLRGIEVGAVDFVSKPFEKDLLIARVQGILKNKSELQNYFYNEVTLKSNSRNISEHHKDFMYKCIGIIENYLADPEFDVKTIADDIGMSYSSLYKKIKSISGQSVNSLVRFVRLRKAAEIMINTNCNVNEAALNAGFNDIKYFREHFTKLFGIKPSEFIKKHRAAFHKTYLVEDTFR